MPELDHHGVQAWFDSYLRVCNRHTLAELSHFVARDLVINGRAAGREAYVGELRTIARGFPDYRWTLQHLVINPDGWLAAHFLDAGTHLGTFLGIPATGRQVRTEEYAFYRLEDAMITELWVTTDHLQLLEQLRSG